MNRIRWITIAAAVLLCFWLEGRMPPHLRERSA